MQTQMKAIVCAKYGPPEVLQLKEVAKPVPKDNEVLVRVHAAAVNPADRHNMRGGLVIRLVRGLLKPRDTSLGMDIAGRVESVGAAVEQFRPGDEVFGAAPGGFAEYACAAENRLVLKPANVSFEAVAAVPVAALTALQGLRDKGRIQPGQKALIKRASGGVGTFAVQIAKAFGAEVTGVCSTPNLDMVRSIGADFVIDYSREDFTNNGKRYDLIFDAMADHSVSEYRRALSPGGIGVIAGFSNPILLHLFRILVLGSAGLGTANKKVSFMGITKINQPDLVFLKELLEAGKVVPVIDRSYPLRNTAKALRYLEGGHARGKVVIIVEDDAAA
jgi:NADPH:quinone reductase-like Zn-dependent oxidoreductase